MSVELAELAELVEAESGGVGAIDEHQHPFLSVDIFIEEARNLLGQLESLMASDDWILQTQSRKQALSLWQSLKRLANTSDEQTVAGVCLEVANLVKEYANRLYI